MSYYETNKKVDSTRPFTNQRATTRLSRFIFAPHCSQSEVNPLAQRRCLPWLKTKPLNRLGLLCYSQFLSSVNIGPSTSLATTGSSVTCLPFYGGWNGATAGHSLLEGRHIQHALWYPICHTIYIHQPFKNRIHEENDWRLLWLAPLSRKPSSSDIGLELLAKAKP